VTTTDEDLLYDEDLLFCEACGALCPSLPAPYGWRVESMGGGGLIALCPACAFNAPAPDTTEDDAHEANPAADSAYAATCGPQFDHCDECGQPVDDHDQNALNHHGGTGRCP
jgi:hypothetical protein